MIWRNLSIWLLAVPLVWALRIDWDFDTMRSWEYVTRFAFVMESQSRILDIYNDVDSGPYLDPSDENADHFKELSKLRRGRMNYEFKWLAYQKPKLLVFLDFDDWHDILDESAHSCYDVVNMADLVIELTNHYVYGQSEAYDETLSVGYQNIVDTSTNTSSTGIVFFPETTATVRARWGIFLLANCEASETCSTSSTCQGPLVVDTNLHLLNDINTSGFKEFSFEDSNMAWLTWLFWIMQTTVLILAWHCRHQLKAINKYHPTVKMLYYSCWLHFIALIFQFQFWTYYGSYGEPVYATLAISQFFTAFANYLLLIKLVLVAKGWTIVRRHLSPQGVVKVVIYASAYFIILFFAQMYVPLDCLYLPLFAVFLSRDYLISLPPFLPPLLSVPPSGVTNPHLPSFIRYALGAYDETRSTVYFYVSPPGILLLLIRCVIGTIWFNYACSTTRRNFTKKVNFYRKFQWVFTIWIVAPAFFVVSTIGMSQFDWTVYTLVWENVLVMMAQYTLCIMYDPIARSVNEGFPFHQITSENMSTSLWESNVLENSTIDDMMREGAGDGDSSSSSNNSSSNSNSTATGSFTKRSEAKVTHVFKNQQRHVRQHVTIADVYSDIKAHAGAIVYIVRALVPKVNLFTEVLEDWDVDHDRDSDSDKED